MTDSELAERLKDIAHELEARSLTATIVTGPGEWRTTEVRHADLWGDSPDGWDVKVTEGSL